jgi:hypothetical protein
MGIAGSHETQLLAVVASWTSSIWHNVQCFENTEDGAFVISPYIID